MVELMIEGRKFIFSIASLIAYGYFQNKLVGFCLEYLLCFYPKSPRRCHCRSCSWDYFWSRFCWVVDFFLV